jgi:hypothetical protein
MPILTPMKQQITLGDVADINVVSGPTMLKTEMPGQPAGFMLMRAAGTWCRWLTTLRRPSAESETETGYQRVILRTV